MSGLKAVLSRSSSVTISFATASTDLSSSEFVCNPLSVVLTLAEFLLFSSVDSLSLPFGVSPRSSFFEGLRINESSRIAQFKLK